MFFQKFKSRATLTSSLNRISELGSKILTFGKIKQKQAFFCFFAHLIVSLQTEIMFLRIGNLKLCLEKVSFGFCRCGAFYLIYTSSARWLQLVLFKIRTWFVKR